MMRIKSLLIGGLLCLWVLAGCRGVEMVVPTPEAAARPTATTAELPPTETGAPMDADAPMETVEVGDPLLEEAAALAKLPLNDFFAQAYDLILQRDPEAMLEMGLVSDPDAPQVLTGFSPEYQAESRRLYETLLDALHSYDYEALEPFDQISYQVFEWYLVEAIRGVQDWGYEYLVTPLSVDSYPQLFLMFFLETHPMQTPADAEGYVARIHLLDEKIDELTGQLKTQQAAGFIAPRMMIEYGRSDIKNYLGSNANSSPLYSVFLSKSAGIDGLDKETRDALSGELLQALREEVFPAFDRLDDLLAELQAEAPQVIGLSAYPGGADYYERLLRYYTTSMLTAEEIHNLGISETERIAGEMRERFAALGYDPDEDLPALYAQLAEDTGSLSGAAIAAEYERVLLLADEQANEFFDLRPAGKLEVVGGKVGNYYTPGSLDGSRPGKFFAFASGTQPTFQIKTIAYHEGIPGHHFQIMGPKLGDLPFFRNVTNFTGYAEGWALYAEYLAWEMGWYADDPAGDLGRLQLEAMRAVRMVVDTGIHAKGWSFEEAVDYMVENTGQSRNLAQNEIVRYIAFPGQATAYLVGKIEIMRMRSEAQEVLGEKFDLRQFHNVVLGNGSMPFPVLEEVINAWVAEVAGE